VILKKIRNKIDIIDAEILKLLKLRVELAKEVYKVKRALNRPLVDRQRENEILTRIREEASKIGMDPMLTLKIFKGIIRLCHESQRKLTTVSPGHKEALNREATLKTSPPQRVTLNLTTVKTSETVGEDGLLKDSEFLREAKLMVVGAGRIGKFIVKFFRGKVKEITLISRNPSKAERLAKQFNVNYSIDYSYASQANLIIMAIPPHNLAEVASRLRGFLKPGTIIVDTSSVKKGVVESVLSILPNHIEYVSIHPLFNPARIRSFKGLTVVVIPVKGERAWRLIAEVFKDAGLKVVISKPEEHDRVMSVVQVAHHLAYLAYALTAYELLNPRELHEYRTRILQYTLTVLGKLKDNLEVIKTIQELNTYGNEAKIKLLENMKQLSRISDENWTRLREALSKLS